MNPSDQNSKLPNWLFIVTDVALIGAAAFVAQRSAHPLSVSATLAIVTCVGLGALVGLVPIVARFERQKNEALDDRQRALEALARTVSESAEQISITAGGLHEITEIAQKNLRHAEQLPHKLQDKIAEFQAQLVTATDAEKEELERELLSLRTTESERLESVSQRIAKSAAEWAKLEAATAQHLAAANEAVAKLSLGTASAIGKAQVAAEQALAQARIEAARSLGEASGQAIRAIESAKGTALADLDAKLAAASKAMADHVIRELTGKLGALTSAAHEKSAGPDLHPDVATRTVSEASPPTNERPTPTSPGEAVTPLDSGTAPKRSRKPRREELAPTSAPETPPVTAAAADLSVPAMEPPPVPATNIAEVAPIAPHTSDPFVGNLTNGSHAVQTLTEAPATTEPPKFARRRPPPKKPDADSEPALGLELDEPVLNAPAAISERIITSDGATRLLVTAYIGIGNRLFIRGDGPGLSWEKGTPLQFVSIGKWRWETNEANSPVQFRLYKNDEVECAALGAQSLDPGNQQEVTAAF